MIILKKWELFLIIIIMFVIGFWAGVIETASPARAESEVSVDVGYHIWSNSGHTFIRSEKGDKEWNGACFQIEGTYWWDWLGAYGYIGMDDKVHEEMFPGRWYTADVWYSGLGVKARADLSEKIKGYIGGGGNYTHLDNKFGDRYTETFDDEFGYDVVTGINYYINPDWYVTVNGRYTWNKMWSEKFKRTSFNPDGLRMWTGLGYVW